MFRMKNRSSGVTGRLQGILCGLAVICVAAFAVGIGFLCGNRDDSIQAATYSEKKYLSVRIDPALDSENNVVASEEYGVLGKIVTTDGMLLYSSTETADRAFYNIIGDPSLDSGRYVASTQKELLTSPPVSLLFGLKNAPRTLTLTLNGTCQERMYQFMEERSVTGVCTQYNVKTGEITAMVSTPGACAWETDPPEGSLLNVCLSTVSPGSTMKLVTLLLAARQGIDLNALSFSCNGSCQLRDGNTVCCTEIDGKPTVHGKQTISDALGNSCNCFFAQLIQRLDIEQVKEDLNILGFTVNGKAGDSHQAGNGDALDCLNRSPSTITLNDHWDFSSVWSLIGEGTTMVNPFDLLFYAASISEGTAVPYPHLTAGTPAVAVPLFPEEDSDRIAAEVGAIWKKAYEKAYSGKGYSDSILVAKTGTAQNGSREMKRLVGRAGDEVFFTTVENYRQNGSCLNVLPVEIANFLVEAK